MAADPKPGTPRWPAASWASRSSNMISAGRLSMTTLDGPVASEGHGLLSYGEKRGPYPSDTTGAEVVAFFLFYRAEFDKLYQQRSLIESVHGAIKRRSGKQLRSRTPTSRQNELFYK